jgi:predicted acyl esterase
MTILVHNGKDQQLNLMGYDIDSVANTNMRELAFQWFDYILKGKSKPGILEDKINYEVMGANVWKHAATFERANNDTLTFFLSNKKEETGYLLTYEKPRQMNSLKQTVDFNDRTTQNNYFTPFIINDSIDVSTGLLFISKPFEKTFSINGSFLGSLITSINKKDMDVSIAFYEQMSNGKYFYLTRWLGRASYAKDNGERQLLKPNEKTKISFDKTRFISRQISKGSRLAIILNVNKHPYEEINYGTGKDVSDETIADAKKPLQIKWFNDSYIKVPVWIEKK